MNPFIGKTPEELWKLLDHSPLLAGPWEERFSETQRVEHIYVRRRHPFQRGRLRDRHDDQLTVRQPGDAAMVWGPVAHVVTGKPGYLYEVGSECKYAESDKEAFVKADEILRQLEYALLGGSDLEDTRIQERKSE